MPSVKISDVSAQVDDLIDFLRTAQGENDPKVLKNSIHEAVWRARNVAWGIEQIQRGG